MILRGSVTCTPFEISLGIALPNLFDSRLEMEKDHLANNLLACLAFIGIEQ